LFLKEKQFRKQASTDHLMMSAREKKNGRGVDQS